MFWLARRRWLLVGAVGLPVFALSYILERVFFTPDISHPPDTSLLSLLVFVPVIAAIVWVGYLSESLRQVIGYTSVLLLPWLALRTAYGLLTGTQVGHDVWATDSWWWITRAVGFTFTVAVVSVAYALFWLARRRRYERPGTSLTD